MPVKLQEFKTIPGSICGIIKAACIQLIVNNLHILQITGGINMHI